MAAQMAKQVTWVMAIDGCMLEVRSKRWLCHRSLRVSKSLRGMFDRNSLIAPSFREWVPSYEIYYAWRNVHTAHNSDHWITRFGPSGKCEAGPILALSGPCRWRTSAISRKKLAKDACKAGCLSIEMRYVVKAFRFVNMPKPQHLPHDLLYYTDRVSTTIQAQDTQYKDDTKMYHHDWTMYWYILVCCFWIVILIS